MLYVLAGFAAVGAGLGVSDLTVMMARTYDYSYCAVSWEYKCFTMDLSACLGLLYMYRVKKRIEDPMNQNLRKELTSVFAAFALSTLLSVKSYEVKCNYIKRSLFALDSSLSSTFAVIIEFWSLGMLPALVWMRAEIHDACRGVIRDLMDPFLKNLRLFMIALCC